MVNAVVAVLSLASLAACLAAPLLHFFGALGEPAFKQVLAAASVAWFVFAITWSTRHGDVK